MRYMLSKYFYRFCMGVILSKLLVVYVIWNNAKPIGELRCQIRCHLSEYTNPTPPYLLPYHTRFSTIPASLPYPTVPYPSMYKACPALQGLARLGPALSCPLLSSPALRSSSVFCGVTVGLFQSDSLRSHPSRCVLVNCDNGLAWSNKVNLIQELCIDYKYLT